MTSLVYPPASEDFAPALRALLRTATPGAAQPAASPNAPDPLELGAADSSLPAADSLGRTLGGPPPRPRRERSPSPRRGEAGNDDELTFLLFFSPGACSLAALTTLCRLDRPFRVCRVSPEERSSEAFRRLNPKGQVPVLLTAEGALTENTAILLDLCTRGSGAGYLPHPGTRLRDRFHEWLGYLGGGFHPAFHPLFAPQRFVSDHRSYPDVRRSARLAIEGHFRFVDSQLGEGPYLLGEDYSVLDAYLFALGRWGEPLFDLEAIAPRVAEHLRRLRTHSEIQFALAVEDRQQPVAPGHGYRGEIDLREALAAILESSAA